MIKAWIKMNLLPFMTLKTPNRKHTVYCIKHTVYCIKHIVEKHTGKYISVDDLQAVLLEAGYPISRYYPISECFFRRYQHGR